MGKPSYAQVKFAESVGVENAGLYQDSVELSKAIAAAQGKPYVPYQGKANTQPVQQKANVEPANASSAIVNQTVLTKTDKPHSYEWGAASKRNKVYYNTIEELIEQVKALQEAGFADEENFAGAKLVQ